MFRRLRCRANVCDSSIESRRDVSVIFVHYLILPICRDRYTKLLVAGRHADPKDGGVLPKETGSQLGCTTRYRNRVEDRLCLWILSEQDAEWMELGAEKDVVSEPGSRIGMFPLLADRTTAWPIF